jgi:hypothetical protein
MPEPFLGLELRVVWHDSYMIEVEARAWNGEFGGAVREYENHGTLSGSNGLAEKISGFPTGLGDDRTFSLGSKISLRLLCVDRAGHSRVEVTLREDLRDNTAAGGDALPDVAQSAFVTLRVAAAGIDSFIRDLRHAESSGAPARLPIT